MNIYESDYWREFCINLLLLSGYLNSKVVTWLVIYNKQSGLDTIRNHKQFPYKE